jgi:uncharacterized membrane protein YbhN (UPF0104 family)
MKPSHWRRAPPLLVVLAFAAAVFLVWREVRPYGLTGMLISHVPGGLGVTEFVVLSFPGSARTWAALIVFRIIYYIVPLLLGGIVLGVSALLERRAVPVTRARDRRAPSG